MEFAIPRWRAVGVLYQRLLLMCYQVALMVEESDRTYLELHVVIARAGRWLVLPFCRTLAVTVGSHVGYSSIQAQETHVKTTEYRRLQDDCRTQDKVQLAAS